MDEIQKVLIKAGRRDLAQKYYLKVAVEFANQKALQEYLKKHPDADKSKHKVVEKQYSGESKNKLKFINDAEAKKAIDHIKDKLKGLVDRDEKDSKELNFVNYDARRKGLDLIHSKGLHKFLETEK